MLCSICEDSQIIAYIKHVDTSLILIAKDATATEFQ